MLDWIRKLEELARTGTPAVLVTVVKTTGSAPRDAGAKMIVLADGFLGTVGGGRLEQLAIEDARQCLNGGPHVKTVQYPLAARAGQCCGGSMELLMEAVNRSPRLYLFGAGHVGQAVCRTLAGTPFEVHLIDPRTDWVQAEEIPGGIVRHEAEWDDFNDDAVWSRDNVYVAIMTHQHDLDERILEDVLRRDTRYVGLIGSQSKWKRFRDRLTDRGVSEKDLDRVHCPIGLDVGGGKEPQVVAISIAAQLLQVFHAAS